MKEKDLPESETVLVEVTGVAVSLPVKQTEVPDPHNLPPGEPYRGSPGEVPGEPGGFLRSRLEPAIPASYGEPVEPYSDVPGEETQHGVLQPAIPGEPAQPVEPYNGVPGEEPQYGLLQPAIPGEPAQPVEPGLPPLEPLTLTEPHGLVYDGDSPGEQPKSEPAQPGDPGLPPLEPVKATKYVLSGREVPAEPAQEFHALKPAIPGEQVPAETHPANAPLESRVLVRGKLITPTEQGRERMRLEPTVPGRPLTPAQSNVPLQPAIPGEPVQPLEKPTQPGQPTHPAVPASVPPTPEGVVEEPVQTQPTEPLQPAQLLQPAQPPYQAPPAQTPPAQAPPQETPPAPYPPVQNQPYTPGNSGYNFPGMPTGLGTTQPTNGDVGPDPNIQFDEAQYTQLIAVIGEIKAGARKAITQGDVYLDAELQLQPTNQTWEPAQKLVKWGTNFGGTVDTENKSLRKALTQFENGLEKAKAVFKETDDLAAYDATKFNTEFPGFSGGNGTV